MKVFIKHINDPQPVMNIDITTPPNTGDRLVLPSGMVRVVGRVFYPEDAVVLHVKPTTTYCNDGEET